MKKVKNILSNRRVVLILGGVTALVLVISGYIWWSVVYWNEYSMRQQTLWQTTKQQMDESMILKAETKEQRNKKLYALKKIVSELTVNDSLCYTNVAFSWQQVIDNLRQREIVCKETQAQVSAFRYHLDSTIRYLEDEHKLSDILATAPKGGEVTEVDFDKELEDWKAVKTALESLNTSQEFNSVKQKARESVAANVSAWEELLASHRAKDKQRYLQAVKGVAAAYDTLNTIVVVDEDMLRSLASLLDDAAIR